MDAFELWCWRRLFRVPWTARRSNQSILKEINPEYSLGGLMLKLQYFGHPMWRANSLEKTLILGKIDVEGEEGDRGWNGYMASQIQWKWTWVKSKDNKGQGGLACYSPWGHKESDMTNWTITATWWEPFAHLIKAFPCLTMSGLQLWSDLWDFSTQSSITCSKDAWG